MRKVLSELTIKKTRPGKDLDFKNWDILLPNLNKLKHDILETFRRSPNAVEIYLDIEVKSPYQAKTNKQLGYLHAAVYKPFYVLYKECGYDYTQTQVQMQLKLNPSVAFVEELYDPITGQSYIDAKSMETASKEEATEFIEKLIRLAAEVGIVVESPEAYRIRNGFTKEEFYKWNE